jgi:methylmalonyl-CoA mutase N-terminal domain/subunit
MVEAIEAGFPQREIHDSSYEFQKAVECGEKIIIGVNDYVMQDEPVELPLLQIDESVAALQEQRLKELRTKRDNARVQQALKKLAAGASGTENTLPLLLDCVREYATLGEMCDALRPVFGEYQEPAF